MVQILNPKKTIKLSNHRQQTSAYIIVRRDLNVFLKLPRKTNAYSMYKLLPEKMASSAKLADFRRLHSLCYICAELYVLNSLVFSHFNAQDEC